MATDTDGKHGDERCCEDMARVFKALANPTRLAILRRALGDGMCVGDLHECLGRSQPNISQHLAVLRDRGLVEPQRDGNRVCYQLVDERIAELLAFAEELFGCGDITDHK